MRYVILVSHGMFAPGLQTALNMMTGEREDVMSCCLQETMSADDFKVKFQALIEKLDPDSEIILLADILSGSPFTNAVLVLENLGFVEQSIIITGMNMPLALSAILMKDSIEDLITLKTKLLEEGHMGLAEFTCESNQTEFEEDEL